jgi:uncharacterized protein YndB with AHSA1/START domain
MQIDYASKYEFTDAAVKQATGKDWKGWFAVLDALGAGAGRKALMDHLLKEHKVDIWWIPTIAIEFEKARGIVEKDGRPKGYSICSTKTIAASPGDVFAAFIDPATPGSWLGSKGKLAAAEGGAFATAAGQSGTVKKSAPGKLLRLVWLDPRIGGEQLVELKVTAAGAKTSVVLNHERIQTRGGSDGIREGWSACFDALKKHLEKSE